MRGDLGCFFFQFLDGNEDRSPAHRGGATAEGADAVLNYAGIAVNHGYVVEMDAQFVRGNLRERSFLALSVRGCSGENRHLAGWFDAHRRTLPSASRHCL